MTPWWGWCGSERQCETSGRDDPSATLRQRLGKWRRRCVLGQERFTDLPATTFPVGVMAGGLLLSCQVVAMTDATALGLAEQLAVEVGAPNGFRA